MVNDLYDYLVYDYDSMSILDSKLFFSDYLQHTESFCH